MNRIFLISHRDEAKQAAAFQHNQMKEEQLKMNNQMQMNMMMANNIMGGYNNMNMQQQYNNQYNTIQNQQQYCEYTNDNQTNMSNNSNQDDAMMGIANIQQRMQYMKHQLEIQQQHMDQQLERFSSQMFKNDNGQGNQQKLQQQQHDHDEVIRNLKVEQEMLIQQVQTLGVGAGDNNNNQGGSAAWIDSENVPNQQDGPSIYEQLVLEQYNNDMSMMGNNHNDPHMRKSNSLTEQHTQKLEHSKSQDTLESDESWLKASNSNSLGFHVVEYSTMSASFKSDLNASNSDDTTLTLSSGPTQQQRASIKSASSNTSDTQQTTVVEENKGTNDAVGQVKTPTNNKHIDTNIGLRPIQENEEVNEGEKFDQSSLMLSVLEGEFMKSTSGVDMSMDSETIEALMKKSQSGTGGSLSFADLIGNSTSTNKLSLSEAASSSAAAVMANASAEKQKQHASTSSSDHSSISMEDLSKDTTSAPAPAPRRQSSEESKDDSRGSGRRSSRAMKASKSNPVSKFSMMSDISQWSSQKNPFDLNENDDFSPTLEDVGEQAPSGNTSGPDSDNGKKQIQLSQRSDGMGNFHSLKSSDDERLSGSLGESLGGSGLDIDISMMSASLRSLDMSVKSD